MNNLIKNLKKDKKTMILLIVFAVFIVAIIVLNITGGSSASDDVTETEIETDEDGETIVSEDDTTEAETTAVVSGNVEVTGETLATTVLEPCIQVGTTTLYLGSATVQDMVDAGAVFEEESQAEVVEFSEDPLEYRELEFVYESTTIYVTVQNPTNEIAQLATSVIVDAYWDGGDVCGIAGVTVGDSLDTLLEKMGDPYQIINSEDYDFEIGSLPSTSRVYLYVDQLDHAVLRCTVDRNTYLVNHIEELSAGTLITDASQITITQFVNLIEDYNNSSSSSEFTSVQYKETADSTGSAGTIESLTFKKAQVVALRDLEDEDEISSFYDARSNKYLYSSYLFVEYGATISFSSGSTVEAVGGFVVYEPYVSPSGHITSDTDFKKLNYAYATKDALISSVLSASIAYAPSFSEDDYTITTFDLSSASSQTEETEEETTTSSTSTMADLIAEYEETASEEEE